MACVELTPAPNRFFYKDEVHKKITALFAMLAAAQYSSIKLYTIAMPFLGTGIANIKNY